ncbi:MAG: fumarylacetoacetate hydrolase family protein [Burkholderiales bacterium]|nr:fumarylacetoacetate hydrolase family protein [Burkholderiales bacterium]
MQLIRFAQEGAMRIGACVDGVVHDVTQRYPTLAAFVGAHPDGWSRASLDLAGLQTRRLDEVSLAPPLDAASTLYLVGANYRQHAEEAGLAVPSTPVFFSKPGTALVAHGEAIQIPPVSSQMDYEGELAVVIGRRARRVSVEEARRCVAGYTIVNDVTARDLQWVDLGKHRIVDWFSSKSLDRSTPVGPWIVPASAAGDPHQLHITTKLNGETMQDADTSLMVYSTWELIAFASARVTLNPGDVISTGTPYGVGGFRKIFLMPGDRLSVTIEGVGTLENAVERG